MLICSLFDVEEGPEVPTLAVIFIEVEQLIDFPALADDILLIVQLVQQFPINILGNLQDFPNLIQLDNLTSISELTLLNLFLQIIQQNLLILIHFDFLPLQPLSQITQLQLRLKRLGYDRQVLEGLVGKLLLFEQFL